MEEELTRRRDKLFSYGVRMQPLVVLVGEPGAPTASYVVIDKTMWKIPIPLKTVDVCFKAYHALHASYPAESYVWLLLQKFIYKLNTPWDTKVSTVTSVMSDLA